MKDNKDLIEDIFGSIKMIEYSIYCDGAYSSIRKQGGAGLVILRNDKKVFEYSKTFKRGTNNTAELCAIIIALRFIQKPIDSLIIYSDSQYCIGCASMGWQRKRNRKLWKEFDNQYERVQKLCPNIEFKHVKGHQKDNSKETKWNNLADRLANSASICVLN